MAMSPSSIPWGEQNGCSTHTQPAPSHHSISQAPERDCNLDTIHDALQKAKQCHPVDVNEPPPDIFQRAIDYAWDGLQDLGLKSAYGNDPAVEPAFSQLGCTLKHIRFNYSRSTPTYVHEDVLRGPYAYEPSLSALKSMKDLLLALETPAQQQTVSVAEKFDQQMKVLKARHKAALTTIIKDPLPVYQAFRTRLVSGGPNASFPELSDVVQYLLLYMHCGTAVNALCESRILTKLHEVAVERLSQVADTRFPYRETVDAIENAVAYLDVHARSVLENDAPPLYHAHRYQYYTYFLKVETPEHIMLPMFDEVGATGLIAMRGVPIGFVGVHPETRWVDGYFQTLLEFWFHDVNHSRRMFQFFKEHAEATGISKQSLAEKSNRFIKDDILPQMAIEKTDTYETKRQKRMAKMIFFEMFHEDAQVGLYVTTERSLLRAPNTMTPFEHIVDDQKKVMYTMEPGATILAYTYRKLAGNFYDVPDDRQEYICIADFRKQKDVASVANLIVARLGLNVRPEVNEAHAHNDSGLPDAFRIQVQKLMEDNPSLLVPFSTTLKSVEGVGVQD